MQFAVGVHNYNVECLVVGKRTRCIHHTVWILLRPMDEMCGHWAEIRSFIEKLRGEYYKKT